MLRLAVVLFGAVAFGFLVSGITGSPDHYTSDFSLSRLDLSRLSKIRVELRKLEPTIRCSILEQELNDMFGDRLPSQSPRELFGFLESYLSQRHLPFHNNQPVLEDIQICIQLRNNHTNYNQINSVHRDIERVVDRMKDKLGDIVEDTMGNRMHSADENHQQQPTVDDDRAIERQMDHMENHLKDTVQDTADGRVDGHVLPRGGPHQLMPEHRGGHQHGANDREHRMEKIEDTLDENEDADGLHSGGGSFSDDELDQEPEEASLQEHSALATLGYKIGYGLLKLHEIMSYNYRESPASRCDRLIGRWSE